MAADPLWFKVLQLLLPGIVAGSAAILGAVLANQFAQKRAEQEFEDRERERSHRMLAPVFAPVFQGYSEIYSALQVYQDSLNKYATSRISSELPRPQPLADVLRRHAIWLTPEAAGVLFDVANLAYALVPDSKANTETLIRRITEGQRQIRRDLGVDRFHESWQQILKG